jgi:hypothetical protein
MPSVAVSAGRTPARERIWGSTLVPFDGRCKTTRIAAAKSSGSCETRFRSASIPPADAPTATVCTRSLPFVVARTPPFYPGYV